MLRLILLLATGLVAGLTGCVCLLLLAASVMQHDWVSACLCGVLAVVSACVLAWAYRAVTEAL